jgi:hypothetical protein
MSLLLHRWNNNSECTTPQLKTLLPPLVFTVAIEVFAAGEIIVIDASYC